MFLKLCFCILWIKHISIVAWWHSSSNLHTVPHIGCTNLHPHQQFTVFPFPKSLPNLVICWLWDNSHSNMSGDISLCFWFIFPWWLVILSIFSCTHWSSVCLLWKLTIQVLCPFLNCVVWFFVSSFLMLSYMNMYLEYLPFLDISFSNIFSHSVSCFLKFFKWFLFFHSTWFTVF